MRKPTLATILRKVEKDGTCKGDFLSTLDIATKIGMPYPIGLAMHKIQKPNHKNIMQAIAYLAAALSVWEQARIIDK